MSQKESESWRYRLCQQVRSESDSHRENYSNCSSQSSADFYPVILLSHLFLSEYLAPGKMNNQNLQFIPWNVQNKMWVTLLNFNTSYSKVRNRGLCREDIPLEGSSCKLCNTFPNSPPYLVQKSTLQVETLSSACQANWSYNQMSNAELHISLYGACGARYAEGCRGGLSEKMPELPPCPL